MKTIKFNTIWSLAFVIWFTSEFTFSHSFFNVLGIALFVGVSLLYLVKGKICIKPILILYILFIIICFINIITGHSISTANSYAYLWTLIKNLFFLISLCQFIYVIKIENVKNLFVVSSVMASAFLLLLTFFMTNSFFIRSDNSLTNANYLAVCDAFALVLLIAGKKITKWKQSEVLMAVVLVLFCVLSGTRKSLLAVAIGIIIYFLARYPKRIIRYIIIFSLVAVISYFALMKITFLYEFMGYRIESLFAFMSGTGGDASVRLRSWLIDLGIQEFKKSPIIGHGLNCFKTLPGTLDTYSHNNYVELLFSVGIIGTTIYYLMHITVFFSALKEYMKNRTSNLCLCLAYVVVLMIMDYAMVSYYERGNILYIALFSFMLYEEQTK